MCSSVNKVKVIQLKTNISKAPQITSTIVAPKAPALTVWEPRAVVCAAYIKDLDNFPRCKSLQKRIVSPDPVWLA